MPQPGISRFRDFIGQTLTIAPVLREMQGAKARGEPMPHMMVTGPSGSGKSFFVRCLAAECGTRMVKAMGYESVASLAGKLADLKAGDFMFVDEVHSLKPEVQDKFFEVIDMRTLSGADGAEPTPLQPFTLVAASDRPGHLLDPTLKRMVTAVHFGLYTVAELKEIAELIAKRMNLLLSPQAAKRLAQACNGLPRRVEHLLTKLRLFFEDSKRHQLGLPHVEEFLEAFGIDPCGLGSMQHRYMEFLDEVSPASLETLSLIVGTDAQYVLRQIEPPLFHQRFVTIRPGGRVLTEKGHEWIQQYGNCRDTGEEGED